MSVTTVTTPPPPSLPTPGVPTTVAGPTTDIGKPVVTLGKAPEALKGAVIGQIEPGFIPPHPGTTLPGGVVQQGVGGVVGGPIGSQLLLRQKPSALPAVGIGAAVGALAGAVLPFLPMWLGAAIGAGVGGLVHHFQNRDSFPHAQIPGYSASSDWVPVGMAPGYGGVGGAYCPPNTFPGGFPGGLPGFPGGLPGGYPGYSGGVPIPMNGGIAAGLPGMGAYGAVPFGGVPYGVMPQGGLVPAGVLAMQGAANPNGAAAAQPGAAAGQAGAPGVAAAVPGTKPPTAAPEPAAPTVAAKKTPKHPGAKTWVDGEGNVRQVGTGKVLKPAK